MKMGFNTPERETEQTIPCPLCLQHWSVSEVDNHVNSCLKKEQKKKAKNPEKEGVNSPVSEKNSGNPNSHSPTTIPPTNISPTNIPQTFKPPSSPSPTPFQQKPMPSSNNFTPSPIISTPTQQQPEKKYFTTEPKPVSTPPSNIPQPSVKKSTQEKRKGNYKSVPKLASIPTFYPTEQEFKNPMKYIASIKDKAKRYGAAKIVPPSDKWLGGKPFLKVISTKNFVFPTKVQSLHQLQTRNGPSSKFLHDLEIFLKEQQIPLKNIPIVDGQELDFYTLYNSVMARGGLEKVIAEKKWKEIAKELKISPECTNSGFVLKHHYCKYLYPLELSQRKGKKPEGIHIELNEVDEAGNKIDEEFGYDDGKMFTLTSFKKMANSFKKKWFLSEEMATPQAIENEYWRIVENSEESVQVHYGSDLDVGTYGSGFPKDPADLKKASGWNLNKFSKLPGSLLSHLKEDIVGVVKPMMYIGMLFSTFCWHTEDNYLYSINYLHHGAPKTWYSVPEYAHDDFEKVMKKTVPELFQAHPDLLFMLITMLSPRILVENGVPVYKTVQEAGEFMITFPKSYHAGFSHGFNCAESSNFALEDWFAYGRESVERYKKHSRASVFSFEQLVFNAALCRVSVPTKQVLSRLQLEVPIIRKVENDLRNKALMEGTWKCLHFDKYEGKNKAIKECCICKYDCYLSGLVCPCSPSKIVCLFHSHALCSCDPKRKYLLFRYKISQIEEIMKRIQCSEKDVPEEYRIQPLIICNFRDIDFTVGRGMKGKRRSPNEELIVSSKRKLARKTGAKSVSSKEVIYQNADDDMYIIDKIVDSRHVDGNKEYLLKWNGFPSSENTWEREEELSCCPALIESYARKRRR